MTYLRSFFADESGATAIEYALVASLISIAGIVAMTTVGTNLNSKFTEVATSLS